MIHISNTKDCCGCTACASICAHNAITMQPDDFGFLYPEVNTELCTNCGLCEKVCSFNAKYDRTNNLSSPIAYGVRHKDMNQVETSRSGAAFIAISDYILENNGVVYGAGVGNHFQVMHKRATTKEARDEFKGSKYVQSQISGIFELVKKDLKDGKKVLFSGTPCQTSGLRSFIGDKRLRENLLLIDIVCHGVPGPYLWRDFLAHIESLQGDTVCSVNFRDKQMFGWKEHKETFRFSRNPTKSVVFKDKYYCSMPLRPSCTACHFCNTCRPSDLTIADFWHYEKTVPHMNDDNKGLSLVLINTERGRTVFENVQNLLNAAKVDLADCMQTHLQRPTYAEMWWPDFEHDYLEHGLSYALNRYGANKALRYRITDWIKRHLI